MGGGGKGGRGTEVVKRRLPKRHPQRETGVLGWLLASEEGAGQRKKGKWVTFRLNGGKSFFYTESGPWVASFVAIVSEFSPKWTEWRCFLVGPPPPRLGFCRTIQVPKSATQYLPTHHRLLLCGPLLSLRRLLCLLKPSPSDSPFKGLFIGVPHTPAISHPEGSTVGRHPWVPTKRPVSSPTTSPDHM